MGVREMAGKRRTGRGIFCASRHVSMGLFKGRVVQWKKKAYSEILDEGDEGLSPPVEIFVLREVAYEELGVLVASIDNI